MKKKNKRLIMAIVHIQKKVEEEERKKNGERGKHNAIRIQY